MIGENQQLVTDEPVDIKATPGGPTKNISPTYSLEYMAGISVGWSC